MMLNGLKLETLEDGRGWTIFDACHPRKQRRRVLPLQIERESESGLVNESNSAIDAFHCKNLRERITGVEQEKENLIEERWKGRSDGGHCKDQKERDAGVDERMNEC